MRPGFPGHVLFSDPYPSVRVEFQECGFCPGYNICCHRMRKFTNSKSNCNSNLIINFNICAKKILIILKISITNKTTKHKIRSWVSWKTRSWSWKKRSCLENLWSWGCIGFEKCLDYITDGYRITWAQLLTEFHSKPQSTHARGIGRDLGTAPKHMDMLSRKGPGNTKLWTYTAWQRAQNSAGWRRLWPWPRTCLWFANDDDDDYQSQTYYKFLNYMKLKQ